MSEAGELALDTKLMSSLESYRVSFLRPLVAKRTRMQVRRAKPTQGAEKPMHLLQKWLKSNSGKKGSQSDINSFFAALLRAIRISMRFFTTKRLRKLKWAGPQGQLTLRLAGGLSEGLD